jgi:hypothetical protein
MSEAILKRAAKSGCSENKVRHDCHQASSHPATFMGWGDHPNDHDRSFRRSIGFDFRCTRVRSRASSVSTGRSSFAFAGQSGWSIGAESCSTGSGWSGSFSGGRAHERSTSPVEKLVGRGAAYHCFPGVRRLVRADEMTRSHAVREIPSSTLLDDFRRASENCPRSIESR